MQEKNEGAVYKLWSTTQAHARAARESLAGASPTVELLRAIVSLETIAAALLALATTGDGSNAHSQLQQSFEISTFAADSEFPSDEFAPR